MIIYYYLNSTYCFCRYYRLNLCDLRLHVREFHRLFWSKKVKNENILKFRLNLWFKFFPHVSIKSTICQLPFWSSFLNFSSEERLSKKSQHCVLLKFHLFLHHFLLPHQICYQVHLKLLSWCELVCNTKTIHSIHFRVIHFFRGL